MNHNLACPSVLPCCAPTKERAEALRASQMASAGCADYKRINEKHDSA
jgi:hypothetical protein